MDVAIHPRVEGPPVPLTEEQPSLLIPPNTSAASPLSIPISRDNRTPSTSADETPDTQSPSPSLITLTHLYPNHGPLSGGEKILAVGSGFRAEQTLLLRFGQNNKPVAATFMAPIHFCCLLPPYHTAGPVIVTLHLPDKPDSVLKENQCLFTYEDRNNWDMYVIYLCERLHLIDDFP
jgi:hypothetical protein